MGRVLPTKFEATILIFLFSFVGWATIEFILWLFSFVNISLKGG